ncbi:MAG: M48 family metallopeptidase [Prevotellaceae bacterium]|jgi:predicted metal-dependent hydrolase|nr:M48 family metallopeptidase [Prevotellaceae bacterium]
MNSPSVDRTFEDPEFGSVVIHAHAHARRIIFRIGKDGQNVAVTVPPRTSSTEIKQALEQLRLRLRERRAQVVQRQTLIDLDYRVDAKYFKLRLVRGGHNRFLSRSEQGATTILCPPDVRFDNSDLQAWLRKVIIEALRRNAQLILPPRLHQLSQQHNLPYRSVKINTATGRWGSCSGRQTINLSCYLLLLPDHLIDYVLLHELAHTLVMNHGDAFHALLNRLTDGKEAALVKELKQHRSLF